ncbi:hypothetical protein MAR_005363 [Mya arenaria]|uniref:Uncharacterized protein n=1 Tax=Mya arenaria TaxID=6604 RepID=A0ABY7EZ98_MYAAR|nr:hypothetical protein MAR_005363 [Mya arenaria]
MDGTSSISHSLKRSRNAVTQGAKNALKIGDDEIYVDVILLMPNLILPYLRQNTLKKFLIVLLCFYANSDAYNIYFTLNSEA